MQFVQFFQVSDRRYLQETEIVFAGITKSADVAIEGSTPLVIFAHTAVEQQVVPPSECTRAPSLALEVMGASKSQKD
jgi:hypothetical protein